MEELKKPKTKPTKPFKSLYGSMKGKIHIGDNFEWTDKEIEELFYDHTEPIIDARK